VIASTAGKVGTTWGLISLAFAGPILAPAIEETSRVTKERHSP
jgi:hypothetical protein